MSSSNNIIKTIQTMEELDAALKVLPDSPYHIVFNNAISSLTIGNRKIATQIPTILYTDDTTLVLAEGAQLSKEDFQRKLEEELGAGVVTFLKPSVEPTQNTNKKVHYVNSGKELVKELYDRVDWHDDICTYYPKMKGKLSIEHELESGERVSLGEKRFVGVVDFRDEILAMTFKADHRSVYQLLWEEGIYPEYNWDTDYQQVDEFTTQGVK